MRCSPSKLSRDSRGLLQAAPHTGSYTPGMEGEVSGIILVVAFAATAALCAMLTLKLWRAGSAGQHPRRDS